jgi:opacity protein-like surface antigen
MGLLRISVIGGAVLSVSAAGALAADMPGDRTLAPPASMQSSRYSEPASEPFAGWYLRGDVGYRWLKNSGADAATGFAAPSTSKFNDNFVAGVGGGLKSGWLRTDLTIDFMLPTRYTGQVVTPGDTTAKVSATTFLLNGYFDLGSWYRITPYIGVGAGTANMRISNYTSTASPPFSSNTARSQWNFAWAGMAGMAYAISPNMMVDLGYRYLSLGDVMTGSDAFGSMKLKNITAHEVRVGLRWNFEDTPLGR